jgi:hypothetical protein
MIGGIQTDVLFSMLALAFILLMGMMAWTRGTVGSLKSLFSWVAAFSLGIFIFKHGVGLYESWSGKVIPNWVAGVASLVLAVIAARILGKWSFERVFGEEGPLAWMMRGPMGAALSLIPSIAILILVSLMVRITGSVYELTQLNEMTRGLEPGAIVSLPEKPLSTRWRDGVEIWPKSKWALDQLDPLTSVANRNLAALVMTSFDPNLRRALRERPSTKPIVEHPEVTRLIDDKELIKMISAETGAVSPVKFLLSAKFRIALRDPGLKKMLEGLDMADEIESVLTGKEVPRDKSWLKKIFS